MTFNDILDGLKSGGSFSRQRWMADGRNACITGYSADRLGLMDCDNPEGNVVDGVVVVIVEDRNRHYNIGNFVPTWGDIYADDWIKV